MAKDKKENKIVVYQTKNGAIEFRGDVKHETVWATQTLREHITKGYTINRKQITKNYDSFMKAVASIENLFPEHVNLRQILL